MTTTHERVVSAWTVDEAISLAKIDARAEGRRVRTVRSVALESPGDIARDVRPAYRVRLAVEPRP